MNPHLFDTDTFTHYLRYHPLVFPRVLRHSPASLLLSIVTVEEVWDGWQAAIGRAKTPADVGIAYTRLTEAVAELRDWAVVPFGPAAATRYADLRRQKLNVGRNDLRIAAIALELGAVVVTANARDFARVPGVVTENWAA